jgi:formate dehydrogenase beta subunit
MKPTDTQNPDYYHQIVDCQWACPAHTDVPQYIRLISREEFSEAYMLNRASNVFPGILGRVCDRPCEPACRRGRVDEKPVAICRLKRSTADYRDEIKNLLPKTPVRRNGKKVALIGSGPASLTVANDLLPLGYELDMFEKLDKTGGLMRSNIPSFRLPPDVLDEEIGYIVDRGLNLRLGEEVTSLNSLINDEYDAVFVGSGAPYGRDLPLPGRNECDQIFIGIAWLESVAFGHVKNIAPRVLIIGGGNTAMDCCRTARRIGGNKVSVVARKPRELLRASDWELEEAEEEMIDLVYNHSPEEFIIENGKLTAVRFQQVEWTKDDTGKLKSHELKEVVIECDAVILAVGQENSFPFIEKDIGLDFDKWGAPVVDPVTFESTLKGVFFGGDAAFGPKNIIWAVEHGHQAAISIHNHCHGKDVASRQENEVSLISQRMGMHEWSYSNNWDPSMRSLVPHVNLKDRFEGLNIEVEMGFTRDQLDVETQRCLNCDIQTDFSASLCIECDACIDVCPVECLTMTANGSEADLRSRLTAPADNTNLPLFVSADLPQTGRVMVKDEDICIHCGLCAERCPTGAWDMKKSLVTIYHAGSKGSE